MGGSAAHIGYSVATHSVYKRVDCCSCVIHPWHGHHNYTLREMDIMPLLTPRSRVKDAAQRLRCCEAKLVRVVVGRSMVCSMVQRVAESAAA
jgi:hypothetical protein